MRLHLLLAGLLVTLAAAAPPASAADLVLSAGAKGGAYDAVGQAIGQILDGHPRIGSVKVVESAGSMENARRLASGEAQLGLVQADVLVDAFEGRGEFAEAITGVRLVSILFSEALHIVARQDLGLRTIADLRGHRVGFGTAGAGSGATAWLALQAHGIGIADLTLVPLAADEALEAFRSRKVDALVMVGAVPYAPAQAVLAAGGTLLPLDPTCTADIADRNYFVEAVTIDGAAYGLPGSVPTIAVDAALVCDGRLSQRLAGDLAELLHAARPRLEKAHPAIARCDVRRSAERAPIPLHPGALSFYERIGAVSYPAKVYVGLYAYSISELDMREGTFLFDGYIWFRWKGFLPNESTVPFAFEFVNGTIESIDAGERPIQQGGWHRQSRRVSVRMRGSFLLRDYPFDTQLLNVEVEHRWLGDEKLVFVPDDAAAMRGNARDSFLSSDLKINDWNITDVRHEARQKAYETDFGSIEKGVWVGTSSRYIFTVEVSRSIVPYAVKLLLPLAITVAMSFLVFWIRCEHFDTKIALAILALVSCVGLHAIQADRLPDVGYLVRADMFFLISYAGIFLTTIEVVYERSLYLDGRTDAARRVMHAARWIVPGVFLLPIVWELTRRG